MLKRILNKVAVLDQHTKEVAVKAFKSSIVKVIGIAATLLVSMILTNNLGSDGFGTITLAMRIGNLLVVLALFGMPSLLVKEIAIADNANNPGRIGDALKTTYKFNGILAVIIVAIALCLVPIVSSEIFDNENLVFPLIIAVLIVIPKVYSRLFSSGLIGFRKIWQSNLVNKTLSVWVIALILLGYLLLDYEITVDHVAVMYGIGSLVVVIGIGFYWKSIFSTPRKSVSILPSLIKPAKSLFLVNVSAVISGNIAIYFLGWLRDESAVGIFAIAIQVAMLTIFFLQVTNAAISPKIASLYASKKLQELEKMLQKVTGGLFLIGIFITLVFIFFGKHILGLWGAEFVTGYILLIILGLGQLVNLSTGAVGYVLIMTGHEKTLGKISLFYIVINIILSLILIYIYGILGAAIAMATVLFLENLTKVVFVKLKTGLNVVALMKYIKV